MRIAGAILLVACGHHPPTDTAADASIDGAGADTSQMTNRCTGTGDALRVELTWEGDADLDLHVVQGPRDTRLCDVYWDCHAGHATTDWSAVWTSAPVAESVRVASTIPGEYYVYVHAKAGTATDVTLRLTTFVGPRELHRAQLAAGQVWGGARAQFEYDFVDCGDAYWCSDGNEDGVVVPDTGLGACTDKWSFPWDTTFCL